VLPNVRAIQSWPLWLCLAITGLALAVTYVLQIPLERAWPGEPFLLFLLVVTSVTLAFGVRVGLISAAFITFLSRYFFEPVGLTSAAKRVAHE
jgi:hypothetical protein